MKKGKWIGFSLLFALGLVCGGLIVRSMSSLNREQATYKYLDSRINTLGNILIISKFADSRIKESDPILYQGFKSLLKNLASISTERYFPAAQVESDRILLSKFKKPALSIKEYDQLLRDVASYTGARFSDE
jgi:Na+-transporting NADH:ubiquinone oxidoreductase subunit NqrC